jgi:hypothetical protein
MHPDWLWDPQSLSRWYHGFFPRGKAIGAWSWWLICSRSQRDEWFVKCEMSSEYEALVFAQTTWGKSPRMRRYPNVGRPTIWYRPKEILVSVSGRFNSLQMTFFAVRNGIEHYGKVKERLEGSAWKNVYFVIEEISVWTPWGSFMSNSERLYSGISGQIFGIYESFMNTLPHNLARLHKSDETGISVLQMRLACLYYKWDWHVCITNETGISVLQMRLASLYYKWDWHLCITN